MNETKDDALFPGTREESAALAGPVGGSIVSDLSGQGIEADFAGTLKRLEAIAKALESGELSLEDSLKQFEEGVRVARYLESVLDRAEQKVEEILNPEKTPG